MEQTSVVLGYWAIRGLSERIRQLMEYCGVAYTEEKYEGFEGRAKWFNEIKPVLVEKNPAITLPYLIDGDKVITESDAILIYICYKANKPELLGRNPEQQVLLATVHGVFKDFHPNYVRLVYGTYNQNSTFETALKAVPESFKPFLKKLDGLLGNKEYICGGLTWIDFGLADFFQTLNLLDSKILAQFPRLTEYQKRIWSLPELKGYFSSPRFIQRPCNNYTAAWK